MLAFARLSSAAAVVAVVGTVAAATPAGALDLGPNSAVMPSCVT